MIFVLFSVHAKQIFWTNSALIEHKQSFSAPGQNQDGSPTGTSRVNTNYHVYKGRDITQVTAILVSALSIVIKSTVNFMCGEKIIRFL